METFPTLNTEGSVQGWSENRQKDTVLTAKSGAGKLFKGTNRVFDPISFEFILPLLHDADKVTLLAFYKANKEKEFYWTHPGTLVVHTVSYDNPPKFESLGEPNMWSSTQFLTTTAVA